MNLFHGSLKEFNIGEFLDPLKSKELFNSEINGKEQSVYLTAYFNVAKSHLEGRNHGVSNFDIYESIGHSKYKMERVYIFDEVNASPFGFVYEVEKPADIKQLNDLFGVSKSKVRIVGKYALTPLELASRGFDVRIMKKKNFLLRISKRKLADRLGSLAADEKKDAKFERLLNKYTVPAKDMTD